MRLLGCLIAAVCVVYLNATPAFAQGADQRRGEEKIEPYQKHHDTHHGHNHIYPDRGSIFRELPRGAVVINYAGISYRFHDGVWFEPQGPAFIVVSPPIGLVVPTLPAFATTVGNGKETYLYANDVYYEARPDLGGYEVVNDPAESAASATASEVPAGEPASDAATPFATPLPTASAAAPAASAAVPATAAVPIVAAVPVPTALPATTGLPVSAAATSATTIPVSAAATNGAALPVSTGAIAALPLTTAATAAIAPSTQSAAPPVTAVATVPTSTTAPAALAAGSSALLASGARGAKVFAYPKNGQTPEVQARDQYECYRFGVAQSGFDPMRASAAPSAQTAERQSDFERAQGACFEGRGYTIR